MPLLVWLAYKEIEASSSTSWDLTCARRVNVVNGKLLTKRVDDFESLVISTELLPDANRPSGLTVILLKLQFLDSIITGSMHTTA